MDLAVCTYQFTEHFPKREIFGLPNQMRRAAVSIPSNIAEGRGRATTRDFLHFLFIARGSLQELETQVILAFRLAFITEEAQAIVLTATTEIARILNGLINSLSIDH
jgi:four helix bundle protein